MAARKDDVVEGSSLKEVLAELAGGNAHPPCFLLYGEEEYQLLNALEKIVGALIPDEGARSFNLVATDGEHEDVAYLCDFLITAPLFPGRKVLVVKDTRLFESKNNLPAMISRIRERMDSDPAKASSEFMQFLALTGLVLDDLRDDGWRKIDPDAWLKLVPDDNPSAREEWLPRIVEMVLSRKTPPAVKKSDDTEKLEQVLSGGMPEGNHLILTAQTVDKRKKLFKTISSIGKILVFEKVKKELQQQQNVMEMAAAVLAQSGKRVSPAAWEALGKKTGFSLRESLGAIEQLIVYSGENRTIEAADVEAVIGRTKEDVVFSLTEALSARNLNKALSSLRELLDQGEAPLMIFSMIVREIRLLFQARLLLDSGRLKGSDAQAMDYFRFQKYVYPSLKQDKEEQLDIVSQHPFVVFQALKNARRFQTKELASFLKLLARTDIELKSTNLPPSLLLESFLVSSIRVS